MDAYNLQRFIDAQDAAWATIIAELKNGRKETHWIWYVFPQLACLGKSGTAKYYGISGADEARAYDRHPVLGERLRQCTDLVLDINGKSIDEIFWNPDDLKFRSSMTLFHAVSDNNRMFEDAINKYYGGSFDEKTLAALENEARG